MSATFDTAKREFDGYGRYLLPDPDSGKQVPWTRATTFAKSIADTFALTQWEMRMVAAGIGMRPDLYLLASATALDDKKKFNQIAKDAKEAAAASSGANLGTALHSFTEAVDRGETPAVPDPWRADIDAYRQAMTAANITTVAAWIERKVVLPDLRVAGKFDRIVRLADGTLAIGDVKTGKDLSYSWTEIAVQLALYDHAEYMWNETDEQYERMPDLRDDIAIVMHLPAGKATCTLYQVDIGAGWQAARLCGDVRQWRSRKNLAGVYSQPLDQMRRSIDINDVTRQIKAADSESDLIAIWTQATANGQWTTVHTAAAAARKKELYADVA